MKKEAGVVGFYFDKEMTKVALVNKLKPEWQHGMLNGIGGKIEPTDSSSFNAMMREAFEEADLTVSEWREIEIIQFDHYTLHVFAARGDEEPKTKEEEAVEWYSLDHLEILLPRMVEGVYNYIHKAKLALV